MATEDIKVKDGRIQVERLGDKENVDVAASDVDSVTFTRSVWNGPGALILHTEEGDVVIRVENDDADEALALVTEAGKKSAPKVANKPATANSDK